MLPPPSTITRLPILSTWPNETDGQPVDADVDVRRGFLAARNVEVAAARRAGADEHRVPAFGQQRLQAVDAPAAAKFDAEIEDVVALLVDHRCRAGGTSGSACASCRRRSEVAVEHHAFIAQRREVARDGERGGAGADQRDALAVLACAGFGSRAVTSSL